MNVKCYATMVTFLTVFAASARAEQAGRQADRTAPLVGVGLKNGQTPVTLHGGIRQRDDGTLDLPAHEPWGWVAVGLGERPLRQLEGVRSLTICGWARPISLETGSGGNRIAFSLNYNRAGFDLVHLDDGRLEIERATAVGRDQGRLTASLLLEPDADQYRLDTDISFHQIRLDVPGSRVERAEQPPIDIEIDLDAVGGTPHELASSANGAIQLVIGKGVMDSRVLDLITADILLTLLQAFNPFAKQDAATELQCGVALLSFENGLAALKPMAFQSDKMTLLGHGKIDLETEKLNLECTYACFKHCNRSFNIFFVIDFFSHKFSF